MQRDMFDDQPAGQLDQPPLVPKGWLAIPRGSRITQCTGCHADITFVSTPRGASMPVTVATITAIAGVDYGQPHWIDCPNRDAFRSTNRNKGSY